MSHLQYRVGIDVGLNSVGLAAIEVDGFEFPKRVLCMESIIHDGGVDPTANKTAGTRKAISGASRRMRRLIRHRRNRLNDLDNALRAMGWPIVDLETIKDPRFPWKARLELVSYRIDDHDRLVMLLSVAVRHIARHRGWRNPYLSIESLKREAAPSKYLSALAESIEKRLGREMSADLTAAEMVDLAARTLPPKEAAVFKIRGPENKAKGKQAGLLESKIHQSDNVRELRRIWSTQELSNETFDLVVDKVFQARSPKGSAAKRVGHDVLPGMTGQIRAEKASLAFQRYRIASIVANLRIAESLSERSLDSRERRSITDFLFAASDDVSWSDVTDHLGIDRRSLKGTAKETADGERASARAPINVTDQRVRAVKVKELTEWWHDSDECDKEALIEVISNGSGSGAGHEAIARAEEFIASLPEEAMGTLDNIKLPEGRAAYSVKSLRLLTDRMLETTEDLHQARKSVFGVSDDWRPPADPIGMPVGNPAVDRVLAIVARWLAAAEREWGKPLSVNIEHTRDGLMSEKKARELDRANNQRFQDNQQRRHDLATYLAENRDLIAAGLDNSFDEVSDQEMRQLSSRDVDRWRAFQRQEGKCLYCGGELKYPVFEMDHIVPRAGQGATNTQVNLAAVCRDCNHSKGKQPFSAWASSGSRAGVSLGEAIKRVNGFRFFGFEDKDRKYKERFKRDMVSRLKRTDQDDPIDNRSIESVGWMANELRHRIEEHFRSADDSTTVNVFRGWITSEARKAAGIQDRVLLIGGSAGKTRLDRRHHAVDAATIAMLRPGAAQVLVVRNNLRQTNRIDPNQAVDWKLYKGADTDLFDTWTLQMERLANLVQAHLDQDRVPVWEQTRLRLGSSSGHEDTIRKTLKVPVGRALPVELIDRSATAQQWVALTRAKGFDPGAGLPEDPRRSIRVKNEWFDATDKLEFFPAKTGCVAVRGGYAELGSSFHHARIYWCSIPMKSGKVRQFYAMMRVYQVDLLPYKGKSADLFNVEIPPQAISRRAAEPRLRAALDSRQAEYLGWFVSGDELLLDMSSQNSGKVGAILNAFPGTRRWVVSAFDQISKLCLRPRLLAYEGLDDSVGSEVEIALRKGWIVSVDVLFGKCRPTIIRRDVLGRVRLSSSAHLPVSWTCGGAESSV
ncbi:type II CRISPR RNA-guided endonuclease Cas9 [Propionimicrobium sp. PCR01-08-3]|uniref:type II CRISPR RNA-guided endonuclease Cas9 n=1 Tax=Propionimicrobium sp. PCR01-08-3 TaxID=3052086 RepID=UPI00255C702D|nr:type II CRISPR RNA-guided endonuclease Cas9 [Propionimicrobium sp. PCR01-08-3]WIY81813.1 HNH endonuclease [Propionimicrobium sp. PCR01-08-3]